jgi:hypothetical protein
LRFYKKNRLKFPTRGETNHEEIIGSLVKTKGMQMIFSLILLFE